MLCRAIDINGSYRIASSCARVGYHPTYAVPYSVVAAEQAGDGNLDGLIAALPTFPYILTQTPATGEFAAPMQTYAPTVALSASTSVGWASGKLFEFAGQNLSAEPTASELLAALHAIKGETLGGLTPPLSFVAGVPAQPIQWFVMEISDGQWTAPEGANPSCP